MHHISLRKDNINELLGGDLLTLARGVDSELLEVEPLSHSYLSGLKRGCFLLRFSGGRKLKGRRFINTKRAKRVYELSRYLDASHFPQVISHHRTALLMDWIDGKPLSSSKPTFETLRECGELQGITHNLKLPDKIITPALKGVKASYQPPDRKVRKRIHELVLLGLLDKFETRELLEIIRERAPKDFDFGLILGDFFLENLVTGPSGYIYFVDTESLAINSYDYDLARTWYRWPMNREQREAYLSGYTLHRSIENFRMHFYYWMIIVLVRSALFRFKFGTKELSFPINKLRELIKVGKSRYDSNPELYL